MRDYFPCRGYSKFIMLIMVPLIIAVRNMLSMSHENFEAYLCSERWGGFGRREVGGTTMSLLS